MASWLDKYNDDIPNAQNGIEGTMGGLTDKGFNYNGAWGGTMAMGGSLPGSVGFTYARTQSPAPSNGPYAKKTKASAQNGIQTFYNNYLQSPKYKERLMKEGFSNPNSVIDQRLKNVSKSKIKSGSESYYDPTTLTAFINQRDAKTYNTPISSVIAHELSHAAGSLGRTDDFNPGNLGLSNFAINQINKRNNLSGYVNDYIQGKAPLNIEKMHDSKPSEFKADMDMLRYRLFNDKIYDAGKQDFNQDVLNKAKQKYKGDKEVERLLKRAKDQDLIWLMNNIAQVNSTSDDQLSMAQNGQEMKYYQEGLDFTPKTISKDGGWLSKYEGGGIIEDPMGQWAHPGEITRIPSNQITMQGVDYPVLGISDTGDTKMMKPGKDYKFKGKSVTEIPMAQIGRVVPLRDLMKQEDEKLKAKSDNTKVVQPKKVSKQEANLNKFRMEQAERERKLELAKKGQSDASNLFSDLGTGLLQPFINPLQPIPTQEQYEANRSGDWLNRSAMASEALANYLGGEMIGAGMTKAVPYLTKAFGSTPLRTSSLSNPAQWLEEWNSNPITVAKRTQWETGEIPKGNYIRGQEPSAPMLQRAKPLQENFSEVPINSYNKMFIDRIINRPNEPVMEGLNAFKNTFGLYDPRPNRVYINKALLNDPKVAAEETQKTILHELTHYNDWGGKSLLEKEKDALLKPFGYNSNLEFQSSLKNLPYNEAEDIVNFTSPPEVRARMNEFRYKLGLNPGEEFTKDHFNQMVKQNRLQGMSPYLKDKQGFVDLMNRFWMPTVGLPTAGALVANSEKENGGWLNKYE